MYTGSCVVLLQWFSLSLICCAPTVQEVWPDVQVCVSTLVKYAVGASKCTYGGK